VEIAFSAGFSEQSHLCRTFKRLTGLTPSVVPPQLEMEKAFVR